MSDIRSRTQPRPPGLIECESIIDVGAGLRPVDWYKPRDHHICIEPYPVYADSLQAAGYKVWRGTALELLSRVGLSGTVAVYFLDSLEHMTKDVGREALRVARECGPTQIVVFTPNGFSPQEGDAWGQGGDVWQLHRSGWTAEDFPDYEGWVTWIDPTTQALFAMWTRP